MASLPVRKRPPSLELCSTSFLAGSNGGWIPWKGSPAVKGDMESADNMVINTKEGKGNERQSSAKAEEKKTSKKVRSRVLYVYVSMWMDIDKYIAMNTDTDTDRQADRPYTDKERDR